MIPPPDPRPLQQTTDGTVHRKFATLVDCPPAPRGCGKPKGTSCVVVGTDRELPGPGHPLRWRAAVAAFPDRVPALPPEPPEAVPPGRRLVSADRMRRDLAGHREPCSHHCGTTIVWARNPRGDLVPVDADPVQAPARGHREPPRLYTLTVEPDGTVRAVMLTPGQVVGARAAGVDVHQAHRETCPKGDTWSRHKR